MQLKLLCVEKQTYSSVWTVGKGFSYASCVPNHPHGTRLPEPANRRRRAQQPPPVPRRNQSSAAARARRRYPVSACVGSSVVTMQHVVERLRQNVTLNTPSLRQGPREERQESKKNKKKKDTPFIRRRKDFTKLSV